MIKSLLIFIGCFILSVTTSFSQWTKEKGDGYYKVSAWYLESDQHYTDTGEIDPNVTRGLFSLALYAEYGLTDKFDIITYFPVFSRAYENDQISGTTGDMIMEGESLNSIGDLEIGVRYGILNSGNLALSSTLKLGLPTGNSQGGSDGSFQTGDGEFNQQLQLDLGYSFKVSENPGYAKTYFAFNHRTENFSDELYYGAETGIGLFNSKLWLTGRLNILSSLMNGSLSAQTAQGSIFANNIEYVSVGGEVAYYFTQKLGISFTYASAISGRIIYANPSYSAGLFLDVK